MHSSFFPPQLYRGADKSLAWLGKKQANVSVRMAWISFSALPCRKKTWWQLASRCYWNCAHPWRASELVSFLVGLMTYQYSGKGKVRQFVRCSLSIEMSANYWKLSLVMEVCSECNVLFKCIKLFHVWFIVQAMWCSVYVTCGLPNVGGGGVPVFCEICGSNGSEC